MPLPPLTLLADDERLFRDSVYEFADREIRPLVREMDEQAQIPRALLDKLFALGVMGIEIPEQLGGGGASFFHAVLAVEALSRVDPSVGVLVDVQNTLVINALLRWGDDDMQQRYLPRLAADTVGAYALSEAGSGSDAFALTTRATERGGDWVAHRPQAVDHQRRTRPACSSSSPTSTPRPAIAASRRFSSSAARRASRSARRKTSSAFAPAAPAS